jgi:TonB family protein
MVLKTSKKVNNRSEFFVWGSAMRVSLIVSFFFHVGVLLMIQEAFPMNWITTPLRTYQIELLRPPVDPFDDGEAGAGTDLAKLNSLNKIGPELSEETISLNTQDKRYSSYAGVIKEQLMRHWSYPQQAWENLIEGNVLVLFTLNREGNLKEIRILAPSTFEILGDEAIRTIQAAAPFPPFPGSVTVSRLHIKANFVYQLVSRP